MITGELKNRIDSLWDIFWTGGITNPLDVVEQITYLMFIHDLDDMDNTHSKEAVMLGIPYRSIFDGSFPMGATEIDGQQFKWSVFRDLPAERMFEVVQSGVFPFIKQLHGNRESAYSKYMGDAIFKIPTPQKLSQIVDALDAIYGMMDGSEGIDVRGDLYEYMLSKMSTSGTNGQFRTPRHIIRMMVELMDPRADEVICDPFMRNGWIPRRRRGLSEGEQEGGDLLQQGAQGSLQQGHVHRIRHGPHDAPYRGDEHDGTWDRGPPYRVQGQRIGG